MGRLAAIRIHAMARGRGLVARWDRADVELPARFTYRRFMLVDARGDTLLGADSLAIALDPLSLIFFRARVASVGTSHVRIQLPRRAASDADTLLPETPRAEAEAAARADRFRRSVESLIRLLNTPARGLPRLSLRDVSLQVPGGETTGVVLARLAWLAARPAPRGVRLDAMGTIETRDPMPFELSVAYARDDRLRGGARIRGPGHGAQRSCELRLCVEGA